MSNIPETISSFYTVIIRAKVSGRILGQDIFVKFVIPCTNMSKIVNIAASSTCQVAVRKRWAQE